MIRMETLTGDSIGTVIDDVARLRIEVFRAWPYLYDGDLGYETRYLQSYRDSSGAVIVVARDGDQVIGASTGTPMTDHADAFGAALASQPVPLERIFYCAESVLLPQYRGRGVGHRFFDAREAHAARLGYTYTAFCAVIRPTDHPARPADYKPLDPFWTKRGYSEVLGAIAEYAWKDLGDDAETSKPLQFWMRKLPH